MNGKRLSREEIRQAAGGNDINGYEMSEEDSQIEDEYIRAIELLVRELDKNPDSQVLQDQFNKTCDEYEAWLKQMELKYCHS